MFVCPAIVRAGTRRFPDRARLKLELVEEHRFRNVDVLGTLSAGDRNEGGSYEPLVAISLSALLGPR